MCTVLIITLSVRYSSLSAKSFSTYCNSENTSCARDAGILYIYCKPTHDDEYMNSYNMKKGYPLSAHAASYSALKKYEFNAYTIWILTYYSIQLL